MQDKTVSQTRIERNRLRAISVFGYLKSEGHSVSKAIKIVSQVTELSERQIYRIIKQSEGNGKEQRTT